MLLQEIKIKTYASYKFLFNMEKSDQSNTFRFKQTMIQLLVCRGRLKSNFIQYSNAYDNIIDKKEFWQHLALNKLKLLIHI